MKDKLRSALWLLKSVDQRQRTIYKVSESIVRHQRGFLDHGIAHLRPLVLRDVATDIGMHESTVSRVVANKYMHTPRGVYELRFFFHSGITSNMGEAISSVTIKDKIRKMIEAEDPSRPLSDSRIAELLGSDGLPLARRTVAKYREELRIPPSNLRKSVPLRRAARPQSAAPRSGGDCEVGLAMTDRVHRAGHDRRSITAGTRRAEPSAPRRKLRKLAKRPARHHRRPRDPGRGQAPPDRRGDACMSPHLDLTATEEIGDIAVSLSHGDRQAHPPGPAPRGQAARAQAAATAAPPARGPRPPS